MPLKEIRKLWSQKRQNAAGSGGEEGISAEEGSGNYSVGVVVNLEMRGEGEEGKEVAGGTCGLPLLQVWPSQDSPRGEADGQSFVFSTEEGHYQTTTAGSTSHNDSGIDSVQASPGTSILDEIGRGRSPSLVGRRPSVALLHPNHARLVLRRPSSPDHLTMSGDEEYPVAMTSTASPACHVSGGASRSSSTASSMTSVAASSGGHRLSDSWDSRRRSSVATGRYSLLDALDLEYALLRAAARGSVGPYSLSESLHKLTFTQSLAFPALARGLAVKRRPSRTRAPPLDPSDSGLNAFAKIITALVLMLVSVMVFGVVYKFVRT